MQRAVALISLLGMSMIGLVRGDAADTDEGFPLPPRGSAEEAELRARLADTASPVPIVLAFVFICFAGVVAYLYYINEQLAIHKPKKQKKLGKKKQAKINAKQADQYTESD